MQPSPRRPIFQGSALLLSCSSHGALTHSTVDLQSEASGGGSLARVWTTHMDSPGCRLRHSHLPLRSLLAAGAPLPMISVRPSSGLLVAYA
jgi:hypothetical protein